jgi:O-6-methylguanine DNA methyltransferase
MKNWQEELLNILKDKGFSEFEIAVYKAVLYIAPGQTKTYSQIAGQVKRPRASRAVAKVLAANPLPLVIPCHRVVRKDGSFGGYKWGGVVLKKKILEAEKTNLTTA